MIEWIKSLFRSRPEFPNDQKMQDRFNFITEQVRSAHRQHGPVKPTEPRARPVYGTDGLTDAERTYRERQQMYNERARGDDGLTDLEREGLAERYLKGPGSRTVSPEERAAIAKARARRAQKD